MNSVNLDDFFIVHNQLEYDGLNHLCIYCEDPIKSDEYDILFAEDDLGRPLGVDYAHNKCIENNKTTY